MKLSRERYLNAKSDKNNTTYKFIFDRYVYNVHQSLAKFEIKRNVIASDNYLNQDSGRSNHTSPTNGACCGKYATGSHYYCNIRAKWWTT